MELIRDSVFYNAYELTSFNVDKFVYSKINDVVDGTVYYEIYAEICDELYIANRAPVYYNVCNYVKRKIETL